MKETAKPKRTKRSDPKIVIVPHYVGTEKADVVFRKIIINEIRRKIEKSA